MAGDAIPAHESGIQRPEGTPGCRNRTIGLDDAALSRTCQDKPSAPLPVTGLACAQAAGQVLFLSKERTWRGSAPGRGLWAVYQLLPLLLQQEHPCRAHGATSQRGDDASIRVQTQARYFRLSILLVLGPRTALHEAQNPAC